MRGEMLQMWLKGLQIAIVEKDTQKIQEALDAPFDFSTPEEMRRAQYLLAEASELLHELKDATSATMKQLRKNMDFLKVTEQKSPNKLDIRS
ncbi:MAG: hypothetical protein PHH41_01000 [Sulfurimonas sp.]|nr:hypothetical protein [Sulfurimonas sp.]MDD3059980.1 hypothetical protein [Sulfurimonas sp.]MDD5201698.1 hypothetical protein [Sulfurimonas sp.]